MDRLAQEGLRYPRACATAPACVAARASLMTDQGPARTDVLDSHAWLRLDHPNLGIETCPRCSGCAANRRWGDTWVLGCSGGSSGSAKSAWSWVFT
ncbi:MAG: hypothetical protein ACOC9P_00850 [bacterium]